MFYIIKMVNLLFVVVVETVLLCCPGWSAVVRPWLTATSDSGSSNSPAPASWVASTTDTRHHAWLIFVFLIEMGFHHVGQAGVKLLTLWSVCLSFAKCWDYRCEPLRLASSFLSFFLLFLSPFFLSLPSSFLLLSFSFSFFLWQVLALLPRSAVVQS